MCWKIAILTVVVSIQMGKRKLRFDVRKNYERSTCRKRAKIVQPEPAPESLVVRLPLLAYTALLVLDLNVLFTRLSGYPMIPEGWTTTTVREENNLCELLLRKQLHTGHPFIVTVSPDCTWTFSIASTFFNLQRCQHFKQFPDKLSSVDMVIKLLSCLDASTLCIGNPDDKFKSINTRHKGLFKSKSGKVCFTLFLLFVYIGSTVAYYDDRPLPHPTIRHTMCEMFVSDESGVHCSSCENYRLCAMILLIILSFYTGQLYIHSQAETKLVFHQIHLLLLTSMTDI